MSEILAKAATSAALSALAKGGDNLAIYNAVLVALRDGAPQACRCGPMCEDRHRPGCRRFDVTPTRTALRALVDAVWQHATESTSVPSTDTADRLITKSIIPSHDGPHLAATNDDALEYALGALRSIAASGKNSSPGQLAAMAQAGIDLATLGADKCAEMRGDADPRNDRGRAS